jgi:hypothetical protein
MYEEGGNIMEFILFLKLPVYKPVNNHWLNGFEKYISEKVNNDNLIGTGLRR